MRHNIIYIRGAERLNGQAEKARPENGGVETDGHAQPSPRLCFRHSVQREAVLRSQGSSSGPLRDVAPTQSGAGVDKQKKTAQSGVRPPIPEGTVEAYEWLRQQLIQPDGQGQHQEGHGVLMRCGLAAWAQIRVTTAPALQPGSRILSGTDPPP